MALMVPGNSFNAFLQGREFMQDFRKTQAKREAGQAFAAGDYGGAAGVLAQAGELDDARTVTRYQQADEDRALDATYEADDRRVASEDRGRTLEKEQAAKRLDAFERTEAYLSGLPEPERQAGFERFAPLLGQVGTPPEVIEQLRTSPKDDGTLAAFRAAVGQEKQKLQFFNTREGVVAVDPRTAESRLAYELPEDSLQRELLEARVGATRAQQAQRQAAAGASGARAAATTAASRRADRKPVGGSRGGSRSGGSAKLPAGFILD